MDKMNQIICGDCVKVLAGFPANYIDLTVTSPPYDQMDTNLNLIPGGLRTYNGYQLNFGELAQQLWRVTRPGGVVVWVVGDATINGSETGTSFRQALYFMSLGFNLHDTMIFYKAGNGAAGSHYIYWQEFEYMLILSKGQFKTFNLIRDRHNKKQSGQKNSRQRRGENAKKEEWINPEFSKRGNVWYYSTGMNCGTKDDTGNHTAFFPEALARDHIISWSNPGDLVLDPMCGSGTTLKMAVEQGRRYIGIDISQEYCDITRRRVLGAQPPLFVEPPAPRLQPQQARLIGE